MSMFRLELIYMLLIVNIRWSVTHFHDFQLLVLLPYLIEITFFIYTNRINETNVKFRQASNSWKGVLKLPNLQMLIKQKKSIASQKLGSWDFWRIANIVYNKGKSAILPLFKEPEMLSSASDKVKLFAKNLSRNSNLDGSGISLPVFSTITKLNLYNIPLTFQVC